MPGSCPICSSPTALGRDNRWRPFCSERCKLVDLSRWLDGEYAIPGDVPAPSQNGRDPDGRWGAMPRGFDA